MSNGNDDLVPLVREFSYLLNPISSTAMAVAGGDLVELELLLEDMEIDHALSENGRAAVTNALQSTSEGLDGINSMLNMLGDSRKISPEDIESAATSIKSVFDAISSLDNVSIDEIDKADNVAEVVVDYLIAKYLERRHSHAYASFRLMGIITKPNSDEPVSVHLDQIGDLVTNPQSIPEEVLDWGKQGFKSYFLIKHLLEFTSEFTAFSSLEASATYPELVGESPTVDTGYQLSAPLVSGPNMSAGLNVIPLPGNQDSAQLPGIALQPFGEFSSGGSFDISDDWEFSYHASVDTLDWALTLRPGSDGLVSNLQRMGSQGPSEFSAEAQVSYEPQSDSAGKKTPILGTKDGSNLSLTNAGVRTALNLTQDGVDLSAEAPFGGELVIKPQGGFLSIFLPPEITADFELIPGVSLEKGFYFDGSVKLEIPIPVNISLGPITISEVYLEVGFDTETGDIQLVAAASAEGKLGPITASVKRIGINGTLAFPENNDGNLGPLDLDVGFEPPSGLGLSIDVAAISGGGYIEYEPENERYAGVFQLSIGPVEVKVMGLLTTEMPDGSDGFSLLISIFGEFPPIQLGFGFTFNGVGGTLGVNRALKTKALGRAVRTGNMGSVLFPEDPVANAQRIVSDLRSIYPPTKGEHVFGPVARFGWGTPPIIYLEMGFVLQLPNFKIALLGRLEVGLPTIEMPDVAQLIRLKFGVLGTLNPAQKLFEVTASLYDSRVMAFGVKGDMAMRIKWGSKPQFLLSVGGFNPRFEPPSTMPQIDRVTVSIPIPGGNPSIAWKGYFAVTSNTVQVGTSVEAKFKAGPVSARGWFSLDALFQFKPFKFVVDFSAGIKVKAFGLSFGVELNGTLKGPSPIVIDGSLTVNTPAPFPNPSPQVHFEIGEPKSKDDGLPTANVLPEFRDELADTRNWSAQVPDDGEGVVALRDPGAADRKSGAGSGGSGTGGGESPVRAHPLGTLGVRQTTVPLEKSIERYGENKPKHGTYTFELASQGSAEHPPLASFLKEAFAPEKYSKMSNSEKMNAPAFQKWKAGRRTGNDLFYWGCVSESGGSLEREASNAAAAKLVYEHKQYDSEVERRAAEVLGETESDGGVVLPGPHERTEAGYPVAFARALTDNGAAARSDHRYTGEGKFTPDTDRDDDVEVNSNVGRHGRVRVADDLAAIDAEDEEVTFGEEAAVDPVDDLQGDPTDVRGGDVPPMGGLR